MSMKPNWNRIAAISLAAFLFLAMELLELKHDPLVEDHDVNAAVGRTIRAVVGCWIIYQIVRIVWKALVTVGKWASS